MLLRLFMRSMTPALSAKLFELEAIRRLLLVLGRDVIPVLELGALQGDIVSCHNSPIPLSDKLQFVVGISLSLASIATPPTTSVCRTFLLDNF